MKHWLIALALSYPVFAFAEAPIERVKITDNDLSCRQIHDELGEMDKIIAAAKEAQVSGEQTATAGQVGDVAAEVASRTGLFAQIGGLFGHVAGTVASKAAAGVAEQSGQKTVQQAQEREKQALARKEHLTALFLARGCKASDPDAPAANPKATVPLPAEVQGGLLPPDEIVRKASENVQPFASELDVRTRGPSVAVTQRVFVPGFRVAFVVKTEASAYGGGAVANFGNRTGNFRTITQAQNKLVEMALAGADPALLQALTDKLYADFLERLKASGKEVIAGEQLANVPGRAKLKTITELPFATKASWNHADKRAYLVFTPKGVPLFFVSGDYLGNASPFDLDTTRAIYEMATRLDAVALVPTLHVDIAEVESSGRSLFRSGAEAELIPKLGIGAYSELLLANGYDAKIFYDGKLAYLNVEKPSHLDGEFGKVKSVESFNTAGLANALTLATGLQGAQHFVDKRQLTIDPLKYANGVIKVGATFNDVVIKATTASQTKTDGTANNTLFQ